MRARRVMQGVVAAGLVATAAVPASAAARPGTTMRVSVPPGGGVATGSSANPAISADGRFVAFTSSASNLVAGDTNDTTDVFVLDRASGDIERVSRNADGSQSNALVSEPSIGGDGRYVTFLTSGRLAADDTNFALDVYLYDRVAQRLELASLGPDGVALAQGGTQGDVSDDGRYVSFATSAAIEAQDGNGTFDIYVRDRQTGDVELASARQGGGSGNGEAYWHDLSGDGRSVAFESDGSDLVDGDTNTTWDVFVRDLAADRTVRGSLSTTGVEGNADSFTGYAPVLSRDGRTVAFVSYASNLVPSDVQAFPDIFVRDLTAGVTERVSVGADGTEPDAYSMWPALSPDGRYVGFMSYATNLSPDDANGRQTPQAIYGKQDYFVHDRLTGATDLVSIADDGRQAQQGFINVVSGVSDEGRHVVFALEDALDDGDTNAAYDVFVRDRGPELGVGAITATAAGDRVVVDGWATFAGSTVLNATDPAGDSHVADVVPAAPLGADLLGFRVVHRPERGDLLVRWRPSELPGAQAPGGCCGGSYLSPGLAPGVAGAPMITYGWEMTVDGARYEVRAGRAAAAAAPPAAPFFAVYRCTPLCTETARLSGSFGGTGVEVRTAVPLSALDLASRSALPSSRAFATVAEPGGGVRSGGDGISLPAAPIPSASLSLALGAEGDPVSYGDPIPVTDGRFTTELERVGTSPVLVWARACLDATCRVSAWPVR